MHTDIIMDTAGLVLERSCNDLSSASCYAPRICAFFRFSRVSLSPDLYPPELHYPESLAPDLHHD